MRHTKACRAAELKLPAAMIPWILRSTLVVAAGRITQCLIYRHVLPAFLFNQKPILDRNPILRNGLRTSARPAPSPRHPLCITYGLVNPSCPIRRKDPIVTPKEVLALCREKDVKAVDLRFMDFPGLWQHFTIPVDKLDEDVFEDGLGFDGSSIRGWQAINESDMLVVPQPETAALDPFCAIPTLSMICNIQDPITREDYTRDPRNVARKAVNYLKSTGIGDTAYMGPELEFFIFDDIRYDQTPNSGFYFIDSIEGQWNRGREEKPNLGYEAPLQGGLFPRPARRPVDGHPQRDDADADRAAASSIEAQHHEVATAGQARDRHALRHPGGHGRQGDDVQVRAQERGQEVQQDGDLHAQAALRRQRVGHAHARLDLEGRASRCSPATATPG